MPKVKTNKEIQKLPNSKFVNENCANGNRVFLLENTKEHPYIKVVSGWKIIGYGKAPWPGSSNSFCAMFEKTTPAEEKQNIYAPAHIRFDEGTRIWQHIGRITFETITGCEVT